MEQISNQQRDQFIMDSLNQGMSLSDVQKALDSDFGLKMTYLELRMLALQLQVDWHKQDKKKPEPAASPQDASAAGDISSAPEDAADGADEFAEEEAEMPAADRQGPDLSRTKVTVSKLVRPGTSLSGEVEFDSGAKGEWYVDQMGRLGLELAEGSSQPNQNDIMLFQLALRKQLQGY